MPKTHGQHFLLSSKARTLSLRDVLRMTDDQVMAIFRAIRGPMPRTIGLLVLRLRRMLQTTELRVRTVLGLPCKTGERAW